MFTLSANNNPRQNAITPDKISLLGINPRIVEKLSNQFEKNMIRAI